jgi:translation initiation factor 2B subunit (eIF-2B alpha/beta/delta family)
MYGNITKVVTGKLRFTVNVLVVVRVGTYQIGMCSQVKINEINITRR